MSDRLDFPRGELRARVVRGTVVNAGVLGLVDLLVLAQGLIVTRLLGPEAIGLYGAVSATAVTITKYSPPKIAVNRIARRMSRVGR